MPIFNSLVKFAKKADYKKQGFSNEDMPFLTLRDKLRNLSATDLARVADCLQHASVGTAHEVRDDLVELLHDLIELRKKNRGK